MACSDRRAAGAVIAGVVLAAFVPVSAVAQDREFCPSRPGLGTPACTIAPGRVSVETSIADRQREGSGADRTDRWSFGETLVRVGVLDSVELFGGWVPLTTLRTRDAGDRRFRGIGDVTLGTKVNLRNPAGDGLSVAVMPQVTIPTAATGIGDGTWGFGIVLPVSYDLSPTLNVQFTPTVDWTANSARPGHHPAYGMTLGLGVTPGGGDVQVTGEVAVRNDRDPTRVQVTSQGAVSADWMASPTLQIDAGIVAGLGGERRLGGYAGIALLF